MRREVLEQVQQHRHRDVVRAGSRRAGSGSPGSSVIAHGVVVHDGEPGARLQQLDGVRQLLGEAPVDLDGDRRGARLEQPEGQRAEPRADLDDGLAAAGRRRP